MPFPTALSGADQTTIRGGGAFQQYLITHTPSVMLQLNPSANASGVSNAAIGFSTTLAGAYTNALLGMTVLITPSTDYAADLKNKLESCLITYVRRGTTASILYVGETNYQWTTGDTVTVLDDFRIQERKTRIEDGVIYKDYETTYNAPLPRIYDLYADVVVATGATYDYSPTPLVEVMFSGGTVLTWAWQVIEGGVLTHTSASQNPTFTLDVGTHWLHLTVTDSGGNRAYLAVLIAVVPSTYASVVHEAILGLVSNNLDSGTSADITAYGSVSAWVPGQASMVVTRSIFSDGTDNLNVEMIGWLSKTQNEISGDEQWGRQQTFSAQISGVATFLDHISLPSFPASEVTTPAKWGDFTRLTPYDAIWYIFSVHIVNIPAIELPSTHTNYRFPEMTLSSGSVKSIIKTLAMKASGGGFNWSPNGEIFFDKSLFYEDTAATRNAAVVYATYAVADIELVSISRPAPGVYAFGSIVAGLATYHTTNKAPQIYHSQSPGGFVPGVLTEEIDGIIMSKDLTDANALIAAGKLAANHYFAANESTRGNLTLLGGYRTIQPSNFQWHKLTLSSSDLLDGMSFDTNTRFLCLSKTISYNPDIGGLSVQIELREETNGGANYRPETEFIPLNSQQELPTYPVGSNFPNLADFVPSETYGDDYDEARDGWVDPTLPPEDAVENQTPSPDALEVIYVPFKGAQVTTTTVLASGTSYKLKITGDAAITKPGFLESFSVPATSSSLTSGVVNTVTGVSYRVTVAGTVIYNIPSGSKFDGSWRSSSGNFSDRFQTDRVDFGAGTQTADNTEYNSGHIYYYTRLGNGSPIALRLYDLAYSDNSGSWDVTVNTIANRADAFYQSYNTAAAVVFTGTDGLVVNGSAPTRPGYNGMHEYIITVAGADSTITLQWNDPDGDVSDNDNRSLRIEISAI